MPVPAIEWETNGDESIEIAIPSEAGQRSDYQSRLQHRRKE
jgi:hypothetical protein